MILAPRNTLQIIQNLNYWYSYILIISLPCVKTSEWISFEDKIENRTAKIITGANLKALSLVNLDKNGNVIN